MLKQHCSPSRFVRNTRTILAVTMALAYGSAAACGDCGPGSPAFQGPLFKYCDIARTTYATEPALKKDDATHAAATPRAAITAKAAPQEFITLPAAP